MREFYNVFLYIYASLFEKLHLRINQQHALALVHNVQLKAKSCERGKDVYLKCEEFSSGLKEEVKIHERLSTGNLIHYADGL